MICIKENIIEFNNNNKSNFSHRVDMFIVYLVFNLIISLVIQQHHFVKHANVTIYQFDYSWLSPVIKIVNLKVDFDPTKNITKLFCEKTIKNKQIKTNIESWLIIKKTKVSTTKWLILKSPEESTPSWNVIYHSEI